MDKGTSWRIHSAAPSWQAIAQNRFRLAQIQQRLEPQLVFQTIRAAARFVLVRIRAEVNPGEAILEEHAELFADISQLGAHLRHEAFRGFL